MNAVEEQIEVEEVVFDKKAQIQYYINEFFAGEEHYEGGEIPEELLTLKRYHNFMNYDVERGIDYIYDAIKDEIVINKQDPIPSDVKYVLSLLRRCAIMGIPQKYSIGIIMMYIELCQGCRIGI